MKIDLGELEGNYDLVFNVGVIEHYLKTDDRIEFLRRKFFLAKPGGFIISIVPSGIHPFRQEQRELGWGGYNIQEIDYTPKLLIKELHEAGATNVFIIMHNVFGHLLARPKWWCNRFTYLVAQMFSPILSNSLKERYAYSFIAIGQRPL